MKTEDLKAFIKAADDLCTDAQCAALAPTPFNLEVLQKQVENYGRARTLASLSSLADMAETSKPGPVQ